jgi:hypothetical protein
MQLIVSDVYDNETKMHLFSVLKVMDTIIKEGMLFLFHQ